MSSVTRFGHQGASPRGARVAPLHRDVVQSPYKWLAPPIYVPCHLDPWLPPTDGPADPKPEADGEDELAAPDDGFVEGSTKAFRRWLRRTRVRLPTRETMRAAAVALLDSPPMQVL